MRKGCHFISSSYHSVPWNSQKSGHKDPNGWNHVLSECQFFLASEFIQWRFLNWLFHVRLIVEWLSLINLLINSTWKEPAVELSQYFAGRSEDMNLIVVCWDEVSSQWIYNKFFSPLTALFWYMCVYVPNPFMIQVYISQANNNHPLLKDKRMKITLYYSFYSKPSAMLVL